ncbi:hypothetical protein PRK78_000725 [Emydomyces testavorans]|uniref:Uncharacterized protein n=1 Tax=Emydomyces testavorans TaxID=2070801 RepID=A0AAF0DCG6_9EURO|nr:hypothetical protein PRK78_000725 [Emydomyces testavorans]
MPSEDNRPWPGPKCDRCENYGYECSENMMARRSSQKDIDSSRTAGGLLETIPHGKFYYQPSVVRALAVRPQQQAPNTILRPMYSPSPWAGLFDYLRDVDWLNVKCFRVCPDPFASMFRSPTCSVPDISDTPLGKRQMYLEILSEHQRLMQNAPLSATGSLDASINFFVTQLQRQHPRIAMTYSFEELTGICANHIRYGSYWHVFRTTLQTDEVLLIDPNYSFDTEFPKITFESAKQIWLSQELCLRQFCQKLSGLGQMISDLARTDPNSEERLFLAAKISDRLEEVLGARPSSFAASRASSFFPIDTLASSPVETTDGDVYSLSDSAGAEESDDGCPLGNREYQAILGTSYFSESGIWGH